MKRRRPKQAPESNDFAKLRIAWIDRLDHVLGSHPGAPPGTDLAFNVVRLRAQLRDYREGFVAALNLAKVQK